MPQTILNQNTKLSVCNLCVASRSREGSSPLLDSFQDKQQHFLRQPCLTMAVWRCLSLVPQPRMCRCLPRGTCPCRCGPGIKGTAGSSDKHGRPRCTALAPWAVPITPARRSPPGCEEHQPEAGRKITGSRAALDSPASANAALCAQEAAHLPAPGCHGCGEPSQPAPLPLLPQRCDPGCPPSAALAAAGGTGTPGRSRLRHMERHTHREALAMHGR